MKANGPDRRRFVVSTTITVIVVLLAASGGSSLAGQLGVPNPDSAGSEATCIESGKIGWLDVHVEVAACEAEDSGEPTDRFPAACEGFPPEASSGRNANPVRLVLQVRSPRSIDTLGPASFLLATQFGPTPDVAVATLTCPDCFESRDGGTYALWLVPGSDTWTPGVYFVKVGLIDEPGILPALARIEIPEATPNEPPTAMIVTYPSGAQQIGFPAIFDGSGSSDPNGPITCYQWTIDSDVNASDEVIQGRSASVVQRTYDEEQTLTVILRVSDRWIAGEECDPAGAPVSEDRFSGQVAIVSYRITCGNDPPVANAGPDLSQGVPRTMNPHPIWTFRLDGSGSHDPDGVIQTYKWTCGNGIPPNTAGLPPGGANCTYIGFGEWTATLVVCDDGNGMIVNGQFDCEKCDSDSAQIRIFDTDDSLTP